MTTKTKNYSDVQESRIIEVMQNNSTYADQVESVLLLAVELEKTTRSISAKMSSLSRSGDYEVVFYTKPKTSKTGTPITSKAKLVAKIADRIGQTEEFCDSLSKSTKAVLQAVLVALPSERLAETVDQLGDLDMNKDQAL